MSNKRARHDLDPAAPHDDAFVNDPDAGDNSQDDEDDEDKPKSDKKAGRRKIKIEFIQDKSRRHITFSKRKAGIMKKAYELSTLTGTQVLLLVVSETGLVYTFTTAKLQPLVTQPEGKNLIQACLNAPHGQLPSTMPVGATINRTMPVQQQQQQQNVPGGLAIGSGSAAKEDEAQEESEDAAGERAPPRKRRRASSSAAPPRGNTSSAVPASGAPQVGAPSQSPHARPGQIPPGAPPIAIPGVAPQMPLEHSPRQGAQAAPPTSPNYAQATGGYPPPTGGGDPNMYAAPHQQHTGYPGAPAQTYAGFGHDGAAAPPVNQSPWGAPPQVQHSGQYARR
ncbi:SRF-type transcription factor (DNA-binding and dimerization domain)-domain-containing protein [Earliella scabrosa]|nr:SRF-type transcription factor (DNA-binding and dimerization domain)-domain-containing protein [Earliella scabrosa]